MAGKFRKIKSGSGEFVIFGKDVTSVDINEHHLFEYTNKYFVEYVYFCIPKLKFDELERVLSMDEYVSIFGGFLLRPDLYNAEQTAVYNAALKKKAGWAVVYAAHDEAYEFVRKYFQSGRTVSDKTFERLLEAVREDVEMHAFVMEQFHKAYDAEKLRVRRERHAIKLLENPDMEGNFREKFTWTVLSDNEVRINKVRATNEMTLCIPEQIGKRKVVALNKKACARLKAKKIIVPETVCRISEFCFFESDIESVVLPEGLKEIDAGAFDGCKNLKEIALPSSIRHIKFGAFACSGIQSIVLPEGLKEIDDWVFKKCINLKEITLPSSVRHIGKWCFCASGIESIVLPEGLRNIEDGTFAHCDSLKSITLPSSIRGIGAWCFFASDIESIALPEGLETIEIWAFKECKSLKEIVIPSSVHYIDTFCFGGSGVESVVLQEGLEGIEDYAFDSCKRLKQITLPASVRYIGANGFSNTGLQSITIPEGVEKIENGAFEECADLRNITIPDTVATIDEHAFDGCDTLGVIYAVGNLGKVKNVLHRHNAKFFRNHPVKFLQA